MNLYEILGVDPGASPEEIRKAYKSKAGKMHPDKGGDVEEFKQLQHAYRILSNDTKRANYDRTGDADDFTDADAALRNQLSEIFLQMISHGIEHGFVKAACEHVIKQQQGALNSLKELQSKREHFLSLTEKVTTDDDTVNLFVTTINQQVSNIDRQIESGNDFIKKGDKIIEMLEHYHDAEREEPLRVSGFTPFTSTSTWMP